MFWAAPSLFGISRCLTYYFLNVGEFTALIAVRSVLVLLVMTVLFQILASWFFRKDIKKANTFVFIVTVFGFSFGRIDSLLSMYFNGAIMRFLCVLAYLGFVLLFCFFVYRIKRIPISFGKFMFACSLSLVVFPLIGYITRDNEKNGNRYDFYSPKDVNKTLKPNLYVIVLDAYSRRDVLQDIYGFDNSDFIKYLELNDFYVSPNSMANYVWTSMSVPSLLNMNYINEIFVESEKKYDTVWAAKAVAGNNIAKYLEAYGYKYLEVNSGAIFSQNKMQGVETLYSPYKQSGNPFEVLTMRINGLEKMILGRTILGVLGKDYLHEEEHDQHRDNIRKSLFALQRSSEILGPKIVFAHILSPHAPFVFDQNGKSIAPEDDDVLGKGYTEPYVDQIKYLNSQIKLGISYITEKNPDSAIILVSDHGARNFLKEKEQINKTNLRDCFPNFVAIRFPGKNSKKYCEEISLVNVLRLFLKTYFDNEIPLLPNQYFFNNKVMGLTEVSDKLKTSARE
jgi:hypothetical protein